MTQRMRCGIALVAIALALAACGDDSDTATTASTDTSVTTPIPTTAAPATVQLATDPKLGPILVDTNGITLYRFAKDAKDKSNCTGTCATTWPPLLEAGTPTAGPGVSGTLATIDRADGGGEQVTYDGMPLYRYAKDAKPGDTTGQGVGGNWFVVPPTASAAASSTTSTAKSGATTTTTRRSTTTTRGATTTTAASATTATTAPPAPTTTSCPYPPCY